ncbi:hypothetical protein C0J52_11868 [Blattella germanica]|nr:hypothetical protein C0J52_11868 [Blattella germanica]
MFGLTIKPEEMKKVTSDKKSKRVKGKEERDNKGAKGKNKKEIKNINASKDKKQKKSSTKSTDNKTVLGELDILEHLIAENKKRILRHTHGALVRELLEFQKNIEENSEVWLSDGIPMDKPTQKTIERAVKWMKPGDFLRCLSIFKRVNQPTFLEIETTKLLHLLSGHFDINVMIEEYIDMFSTSSCNESNLWTLEKLEQTEMEELKTEQTISNNETLPMPQKKKKSKKSVLKKKTPEIMPSETESTQTQEGEPQYQWGVSIGKLERFMKGPETIIIKNLKKALKCLFTFKYTLDNSPINIVFSPFSTLPEVDENEESYKVCFKCGRSQRELKICPTCKHIAFCPEDADVIDEEHRCQLGKYLCI